jgi:hypothetical protein
MFYRSRRTENGGALAPQSECRQLMAMHKVGAVHFRKCYGSGSGRIDSVLADTDRHPRTVDPEPDPHPYPFDYLNKV